MYWSRDTTGVNKVKKNKKQLDIPIKLLKAEIKTIIFVLKVFRYFMFKYANEGITLNVC